MDKLKKPEYLKKYIKETHWIFAAFVILNYPFRWLAYILDKVAFLKILEYVSLLGVITAVYFYISESGERLKARHYQAWQVINSAQGKPGNGGRSDALRDLYNDGVSLANIDLSLATIPGISLKNAHLMQANLSGANLEDANFSGADLGSANFSGANLRQANFSGAKLSPDGIVVQWNRGVHPRVWNVSGAPPVNFSKAKLPGANLSKAHLSFADLSGAILWQVNLSGAIFCDANFSGADLFHANLSGADALLANFSGAKLFEANLSGINIEEANFSGAYLSLANLSDANLYKANLSEADLYRADINSIKNYRMIIDINNANIYGVKNAPDGFIEWAKEHGALSIENRLEWERMLNKGNYYETKK